MPTDKATCGACPHSRYDYNCRLYRCWAGVPRHSLAIGVKLRNNWRGAPVRRDGCPKEAPTGG